ncbi:hypothetical protein OV090_42595 [Nannocystis sp. RBIL2]|uniref:hypothetical protein n=1 Tax=Nannocystis sp. RBIL2 TaxID=2996788 RepID=UPI00226FCEF0|nr:hypothetical protein [Nannocystis sp. RBIL2]MCY1071509.1 hypothetical protein [Nannocystis sp. RBIL2]
MRTSTNTISLLLASTFILGVACDDATGPGFAADDDVALRCTTPDCTPPPINNTSKIGDHYLSNIAMTFNTPVENETAEVFIEGATAIFGGTTEGVAQIAVGDNGELRLRSVVTNTIIGGEAVEGARFYVYLDSYEDGSRKLAHLRIADAECDPGLYDPSITICRYTFVTDAVPADTELYPEHETLEGWYHTCPNETEGGQLGSAYKFSSVLSPNVALSIGKGTPSIEVAPGTFINGCLNGAVSKGQYRLNAFYDSNATRGLDPSQRTPMLLMWMAWHAGGSRTVPGQQISPHDPIGGLFTWTSQSNWDIEAGYGETGATCRGGSPQTGMHRLWIDPVLTLIGWDALPHCDASDLDDYAVLGVKVQADLW